MLDTLWIMQNPFDRSNLTGVRSDDANVGAV
jgi:hypothetical protein